MKRIPESQVDNEFERQYAWGDDERFFFNPKRKKSSVMGFFNRLELVIRLIQQYSTGERLADLACAQGTFALQLAEKGFDVTAVDIKEDFLRYANKKYEFGKFKTHLANLMEFNSEEPFDTILMGEVIEHVAFPKDLLQVAYRNLREGGILVVTTPNGDEADHGLQTYSQVTHLEELIPKQFHWGEHLFLYTEKELRGLLEEAGFQVLEVIKLNSYYVTQIKGFRYLLPLSWLKWIEVKTRSWKRKGKDSTNGLVVVAKKGK